MTKETVMQTNRIVKTLGLLILTLLWLSPATNAQMIELHGMYLSRIL